MPKQNPKPTPAREAPGPGRSTSEAAFNDLRKEIAQRNERAHHEARKIRGAREREQLLKRRERDL
jgi:pyruvate/2-oxoglutarate dehydrogenase complex dihydrolipoamide acyltransferase (E2) component